MTRNKKKRKKQVKRKDKTGPNSIRIESKREENNEMKEGHTRRWKKSCNDKRLIRNNEFEKKR